MSQRWLSKPAVLWVLYEAPNVPAHLLSTLIVVAAHAGTDGTGAYISAATVGQLTRKTESQAKRDLRNLEKQKLIHRGNQRLVAHIRADKRPVVYDLDMPRGSTDATPQTANGVAHRPQRGSTQGPNGVAPVLPKEVPKTSGKGAPRDRAWGADTNAPGNQNPAAGRPGVSPMDLPAPGLPPAPCCGHQFTMREYSGLAKTDEQRRAAKDGRLLCGDPGCGLGTLPAGMAL